MDFKITPGARGPALTIGAAREHAVDALLALARGEITAMQAKEAAKNLNRVTRQLKKAAKGK